MHLVSSGDTPRQEATTGVRSTWGEMAKTVGPCPSTMAQETVTEWVGRCRNQYILTTDFLPALKSVYPMTELKLLKLLNVWLNYALNWLLESGFGSQQFTTLFQREEKYYNQLKSFVGKKLVTKKKKQRKKFN